MAPMAVGGLVGGGSVSGVFSGAAARSLAASSPALAASARSPYVDFAPSASEPLGRLARSLRALDLEEGALELDETHASASRALAMKWNEAHTGPDMEQIQEHKKHKFGAQHKG